ncbi:MAG: hypothetical protein RIQ58_717 [Pseudomonadota bacterium]
MKLIYILYSLFAILSLSGCQHLSEKNTTLKAELTVFHEIPSDFKPSTIAIVPWHQSQKNSLEFKNYAAILKDRIEKLGFIVIDHQKKPELLLFFDYGDDNGKEMTETYTVPDFGMIGYTGYSMNSWGMYTGLPMYGYRGYQTHVNKYTLYTRHIYIDIAKPKSKDKELDKIYEGSLRSKGTCSKLTVTIPYLIDMYFNNFPGKNSETQSLEKSWNGVC